MALTRWVRGVGWGLALGGATWLDAALARAAGWGEVAAGLAVLAGLGGGLLVEAAVLALGRTRPGRGAARPFRPADGMAEVLSLVGVRGDALGEGVAWQRFVGLDPIEVRGNVRQKVGGETRILGQVALVSVFVGQDGKRWSAREIRGAHESLRASALWVEREAAARGAPVNVGLVETFFDAMDEDAAAIELAFVAEGDGFGPMEADAAAKAVALVSRVAAGFGFADVADLIARVNARVAADTCVWLVHLRRRGRSHAIPSGDGFVDGVGLAVCYARESSFPEPLIGPARVDPTTVVHELLHLGGATDKYGVPLANFPAGTVPRRDVMRLDEERLDRLKVGPLTARELGWIP